MPGLDRHRLALPSALGYSDCGPRTTNVPMAAGKDSADPSNNRQTASTLDNHPCLGAPALPVRTVPTTTRRFDDDIMEQCVVDTTPEVTSDDTLAMRRGWSMRLMQL